MITYSLGRFNFTANVPYSDTLGSYLVFKLMEVD